MADITSSDFKQLIEAQQETTRQLMTAEERAADDAQKAEQFRVRSEAAKKGHETRIANQQNQAVAIAEGGEEEQEKSTSFLGRIAKQFDVEGQFRARQAEAQSKEEGKDSKMLGYLKSTAGFLGGIAKQGMEKVKSGLSGFSKFAFGGLALAALAFLNNPKFEEIKNTIIDIIVPLLAYLYDEVIKPLALYIGGKLKTLFEDLKAYVDGEKGLGQVIFDNIGIIAGIVTALAPNLVFGALKTAVLGIGKALLWVSAKTGITAAIMGGFAAIKSFFVVTLLPFLTALAIPIGIVVGVTATIVSAAYAIKQAFDDFLFELEATGSAWEATKTAFVSFFANFLGFIPNLIKDAVSWIVGKFGDIFGIDTSAVTKAIDEFDFVVMIKDGLTAMGNGIAGLFDYIVNFVQDVIRKIPFKGDDIADALFGTKKQQEDAKREKAEEQKLFEENRKALREQQKLEKEAAEAKKIAEVKKKQESMMMNVDQSMASNRQKMIARRAATQTAAPAPSIVNAPTTVSAPNTTNVTSTTTTLSNNDRVIDSLSFVT